MQKQEIIAVLHRDLQAVIAKRQVAKANAATFAARSALKHFQSTRMAQPHDFVAMIIARERTILQRLYAGRSRPFESSAT